MTKSEARGEPLTGELALPSKTARGYRARERWARAYDELNGAPEGDWDR